MNNWTAYQTLRIDNVKYSKKQLSTFILNKRSPSIEEWELDILNFIEEWLNDKDYIIAFTSGSTGKPKEIKLKKSSLVFSALNTLSTLKLKSDNKALLCIPAKYIGGKMMIVRSFVGDLNLSYEKPNSNINSLTNNRFDFCAITPFQAQKTSNKSLSNSKIIIIGGGQVNNALSIRLSKLNNTTYSTYGMTETSSHIALKNISKKEHFFKTFKTIQLSTDERNCLCINAPELHQNKLITNDIVDILDENKFIWKGRYDNIINSGGIKLIPEQIEEKLTPFISQRFFITKEDDEILGEKVVLLIENKFEFELDFISDVLSKYEIPKNVYFIDSFYETENGKINRKKTLLKLKGDS